MVPGRGRPAYRASGVRGDSMIDEQIRDGDLVVIEERPQARDGETVVALVDGHEATLKKLYREGATVRLQPANATLGPAGSWPADRPSRCGRRGAGVITRHA